MEAHNLTLKSRNRSETQRCSSIEIVHSINSCDAVRTRRLNVIFRIFFPFFQFSFLFQKKKRRRKNSLSEIRTINRKYRSYGNIDRTEGRRNQRAVCIGSAACRRQPVCLHSTVPWKRARENFLDLADDHAKPLKKK